MYFVSFFPNLIPLSACPYQCSFAPTLANLSSKHHRRTYHKPFNCVICLEAPLWAWTQVEATSCCLGPQLPSLHHWSNLLPHQLVGDKSSRLLLRHQNFYRLELTQQPKSSWGQILLFLIFPVVVQILWLCLNHENHSSLVLS